ncbi:hypothetical protein [Pantoea stewartii]|uniref:hypothetical protein n=1 Tax=Pantoea stewartii TaxID=66269 RepID=UPI00128ED258|nr:hypothetical protein [Pantoea stewartii]
MLSPKLFSSLFGQANQSGEKSTVLHTIIWLLGVVIVGVVLLARYQAAAWIIIPFLCIFIFGSIFYACVFWFCLKNNPDLLRSERMVIQKLAIEKQYVGDSINGDFTEPSPKIMNQNSDRLLDDNKNTGVDK